MDVCLICSCNNDLVILGEKGANGINRAAEKRGSTLRACKGQHVHSQCRRNYTNPTQINKYLNEINDNKDVLCSNGIPVLRSAQKFSFREQCLFCGQSAILRAKKRGYDVFPVRTTDFQRVILSICHARGDAWADTVRGRIEFVNDLHASDALYHQTCNVNFRTGKSVPSVFSTGTGEPAVKMGRPISTAAQDSFLEIVRFLSDHEDEQHDLTDLTEMMQQLCGSDAYSPSYMKKKLREYFGEDIITTDMKGKSNIITIRKTAASILHAFHEIPQSGDDDEKISIIKAAANLIKSDIKSLSFDCEYYPSSSDISMVDKNLQYIPESLQCFLLTAITIKDPRLKVSAIGQAIMQAVKPKSQIAPLQLGLGVQLHHHFASKFLIDTLHSLGFCCPYSEIQRFESSAAVSKGTLMPDYEPSQFLQYVADNVDHDIRTIDGRGTFHGMGIIAAVTPGIRKSHIIKRVHVSPDELENLAKIDIKFCPQPAKSESSVRFIELHQETVMDTTLHLEQVSKIVWPLRCPTPSWSGVMQMCHKGPHPGKSAFVFLPMIDMDACNITCVFSTLSFVVSQAKKYNSKPIITFDQPLYWKALAICSSKSADEDIKSILLKLGGFHLEMSFIGCIGHIMRNSGLREMMETVYAPNAVTHILSGKAVARAIRAHGLIDTALHCLLASSIFELSSANEMIDILHSRTESPTQVSEQDHGVVDLVSSATEFCTLPKEQNVRHVLVDENENAIMTRNQNDFDILELASLFDKVLKGEESLELFCTHPLTLTAVFEVNERKRKLTNFKTPALWIQYLDMVNLLFTFIKAERTGNWNLHLQCVQKMLPYFASAGHNLYAKSAYVYLQTMKQLQTDHPDIHASFQDGLHVLRRSNRYWAGLSSDLVIEQVLMRSVKTRGGLTRGRGMTEAQRSQWLLSMPSCAEFNDAMQSLSGIQYHTSDQHKDASQARQERDKLDIETITSYIKERNPFAETDYLRNLATGLVADDNVNSHLAYENGLEILSSMKNENVFEYSFKRSKQVKTIPSESSFKTKEDIIEVDPQLLFQRLIAISSDELDFSDIFKYELATFPSSLYESNGLPRSACKSQLADTLWKLKEWGKAENEEPVQYVLDGGSLLHKINWPKGMTFDEICKLYTDYVQRQFGHPIVIFDGYTKEPSTKDITHIRRSKGIVSPDVDFTAQMPCKLKKDVFLTNTRNKQMFINLLGAKLAENGCTVRHASGDADRLIVMTAIDCSKTSDIKVVGEDTDLLVLLCYFAEPTSNRLFLVSDRMQNSRFWDISQVQQALGRRRSNILPVIHSLTGCDTTSRLFGIGKGPALKKLGNEIWDDQLCVFLNKSSSKHDICSSGEQIISHLYGGVPHEGLDLLRFRLHTCKAISRKKCIQIQSLPPTSDAAALHSMRAYYQCQEWLHGEELTLNACDWGYYLSNGNKYIPVRSTLPPAPEKLLKVIHCNCKTNCDTKRCTCRKHGLECSVGCGECRGFSCSNTIITQVEQD